MKPRHALLLALVFAGLLNAGCIHEKLVENDRHPTAQGPTQHERWTYTLRCPVGTWQYRIALNPRLVDNRWVAKETVITSSTDPLMTPNTFTIAPSLDAPNTGEVLQYGTRHFRFYTDDAWVKSLLVSGEKLDSAHLLIQPDNFQFNKSVFENRMVVRFYYYAKDSRTPANETVVALVGTFNQWGKGGERSRLELHDDGVFPDKTAGDGVWTIEVPLESTFTYKYKFLVDAQWDASAGQWKDGTGTFVPDYANRYNTLEGWRGDSYLTVN